MDAWCVWGGFTPAEGLSVVFLLPLCNFNGCCKGVCVPRVAIVWVQRIAALLLRAVSPAKDHPSHPSHRIKLRALECENELCGVCFDRAHTHTRPLLCTDIQVPFISPSLVHNVLDSSSPTERQEKGVDGLSDYTQYK